MAVSIVPDPNKPLNTVPGTVKAINSKGPVPDPNYKPKATGQLTVPKKVTESVPSPNMVNQPTSSINANDYSTWKTKTDENYNNLQNLTNGTFQYNPETDPRYQAFQTLSKQRAGVASQSAMESLNDRGILNSSVTGSQLAQIQQGAEQEALAAIPQFYDQARSDYQNKISNASKLLDFSAGRNDADRDYGLNVADRTGYITPDGSNELKSQLLALKGQAEARGTTPEQRKGLSQQADAIRSQLQSMGVDISGLGANVNQANASTVNFGTRTMAGQNQDYNQQANTRDYNRGVEVDDRRDEEDIRRYNQDFEYTQGQDKEKDRKWELEFEHIKQQDGIANAIKWANQNLNERQESRIASNNSGGGSNGSSSSGPSKESSIQDINLPRTAASMETYIINNLPGGKNVAGPPSPNQQNQIEGYILGNPNLSDADIVKLYKRFGIPLPE